MIISDKSHILFVEPKLKGSIEPLVDNISNGFAEIFKKAKPSNLMYKGWHTCVCGETSDNKDWILHNGQITNSLCVHYLEYHREEIPELEMAKVKSLLYKFNYV